MKSEYKAKKICAIILSGGYSSRMGRYKPLLPFGKQTFIEKLINTYTRAGIKDIFIVTGYNSMVIRDALNNNYNLKIIENKNYNEGMYSSVKAGVENIKSKGFDAFFINPVDCPLIRTITLIKLIDSFYRNDNKIIYPNHLNRRGHPPIIPNIYLNEILCYSGEGGLKKLLRKYETNSVDVDVEDSFILDDIDTEENYKNVLERINNEIPNYEECINIMKNNYVDERIIQHCKVVYKLSILVAEKLNSVGLKLDVNNIRIAALLHDISRKYRNHAFVGEYLVSELGFFDSADIIAEHMDINIIQGNCIEEKHIVYLVDKLVEDINIISLEKKFEKKSKLYNDKNISDQIGKRYKDAVKIKEIIESIAKMKIEEIINVNEK